MNLPILKERLSDFALSSIPTSGPKIQTRTMFIFGELSPHCKPEHDIAIYNRFANVRIEKVPSAGHWVHSEKPQPVWELLNQFL